jgi:hypothetical protein
MTWLPTWYVPLMVLIATAWALAGTNAQAALARRQLLANDDPLIAAAGKLWRPYSRLVPRRLQRQRAEIEAELLKDSERWSRYEELERELWAWNMLESSVALAAVASIPPLLASLH